MRGKIRLDGRKHVETTKGFPIIIYLTKDSKEKLILSGFHSSKEDWDKANGLPKKSHPEYTDVLNWVEEKKVRLRKIIVEDRFESITLIKAAAILSGEGPGDDFRSMGLDVIKRRGLSKCYPRAVEDFAKLTPGYKPQDITEDVVISYRNQRLKEGRSPNGLAMYMSLLSSVWNKLDLPRNPFKGNAPKKKKTKSKALSDKDLYLMDKNQLPRRNATKSGGMYNLVNYEMLCFYLGGLDLETLASLRYDEHVVNGRIETWRGKGDENAFISNKIFPQAQRIMDMYDCYPYVIPLRKTNNYESFVSSCSMIYGSIRDRLGLSKKPYTKAPRYTFIQRAKELLVEERIAMQIVGHKAVTTHSIYEGRYPNSIVDPAHEKIINFKQYPVG